jgi:hypothetical protein
MHLVAQYTVTVFNIGVSTLELTARDGSAITIVLDFQDPALRPELSLGRPVLVHLVAL